jgi:cbb3-type cytochrome oxidase cytochrome c subunit
MAASDKPYRSQSMLDTVFGVTSLLMLVSVIAMLVQDYNREYKPEQRVFRDVETAMAQRQALDSLPSAEEMQKADAAVAANRETRTSKDSEIKEYRAKARAEMPKLDRANAAYQDIKADLESVMSFYNIEVEHNGPKSAEAGKLLTRIVDLESKLEDKQAERDAIQQAMAENAAKADDLEAPLTKALSKQKQVYDRFDSLVKTSLVKRWGFGDSFRSLPIIDGFASPTKIQQITNNDIPIDYYFKPVTRFDRCTTCHLGIDRPAYTQDALTKLCDDPKMNDRLVEAKKILEDRRKLLEGLPEQSAVADPNSLTVTTLPKDRLTASRVREFAAHPRLDLFVGANSKHPMEKFGCSTCHSGQGSGTSFTWASHVPNNVEDRERWMKDHHWHEVHSGDWDYPMLPSRFVESSCLKCHHQVTDLVARDGREEAPKLLKGYHLIREFGCFGCHEISGTKGGKAIGPDLHAEPSVPLDEMTTAERVKADSDPDAMPGKLRRVGPSLVRLAEKTYPEWTAKWIRAPRAFRPDTKMPHYFGLANNHPDVLPEDQKKFPDAEIQAITHYLFKLSENQVKEAAKVDQTPDAVREDERLLTVLETKSPQTDAEKKQIEDIQRRRRLRKIKPLEDLAKDHKADAGRGQQLFVERGCLACHSHQATQSVLPSLAEFGPNLSQIKEKLGKKKGDTESAKVWLTQWIMNPQFHHPRSRMPVTHLDAGQAADIAEWLLSQPATDLGEEWNNLTVAAPEEDTLKNLAKVYLVRLLPKSELTKFMKGEAVSEGIRKDLPADEKYFLDEVTRNSKEALLSYVGRKAVSRLGCYACHEIPGYENAKPIGVGLNDWGKKDASRLAFEDVVAYVKEKYTIVASMTDKDGNPVKTEKPAYEQFFFDMLDHHGQNRMGYLHQKINEPRSYDWNRIRAWDDRSRMPQFKFSRMKKNEGESDEDFAARKNKAEADAREAVMTFILGLTAESLPAKAVNMPTGDRAAEVRGRQVLDNFNCSGCHLIRPGYFELKPSEATLKTLESLSKRRPEDHVFPGHRNWTGVATGAADKVVIHGLSLTPTAPSKATVNDEEKGYKVPIRLMDATRFTEENKSQADVFASKTLFVPSDELTYPKLPAKVLEDANLLFASLRSLAYGGTFADNLTLYLAKKDPNTYKPETQFKDNSNARPAVPPSLHGQGERTQGDWLYQFLLNPYPVRKMAVLRMPRFNLSPDEARALVDYFAGVERLNNPGAGTTYPFEDIAQQGPAVQEGYFRQKNAEYIARLKATKGADGKTMYEQRLQDLNSTWEQLAKQTQSDRDAAKTKLDAFAAKAKEAETADVAAKKKVDDATAALGKAKDDEKKKLEGELADAKKKAADTKAAVDFQQRNKDLWEKEIARLDASAKQMSVESQQKAWTEKDAYLTDAYRLVMNKQLCMQCHQIGTWIPNNPIMGPPLHLAHQRLRPGWTQKWVAHPERFLPYQSSMPALFTPDQNAFADVFPGSALDRVTAARDVLMAYPEVAAMPINRQWVLPTPPSSEKEKSEKSEKK